MALYPKFQEYFRTHRPPTLAVWGRNDPFFLPAGAEAFRRDNPSAEPLRVLRAVGKRDQHGHENDASRVHRRAGALVPDDATGLTWP